MKALVNFLNGKSMLVKVNRSYSRGGVHYYDITLNALDTFLDFKAGETKLFTAEDFTRFVYVMS